VPVEIEPFLLKLLLKQRNLAVHHDSIDYYKKSCLQLEEPNIIKKNAFSEATVRVA